MNDSAEVTHASLTSVISEEPQEFRHATSLDNALQHLIPTLQSHKGDLDLFFMLGCWISRTMHLYGIGFGPLPECRETISSLCSTAFNPGTFSLRSRE